MTDLDQPARKPGRRITSARLEFCRLAEQAEVGDVGRGELRILVEDLVSTGMISSAESHLLAKLINTAPKASFTRGGRPIVYKSNRQLGFEIGRSEGRVSRMLSKLFDLGLVAMQDSANYKRYPVRNEHGRIVSGCGVDLRILIHRYDELRVRVEECRADIRVGENNFGFCRKRTHPISPAVGVGDAKAILCGRAAIHPLVGLEGRAMVFESEAALKR